MKIIITSIHLIALLFFFCEAFSQTPCRITYSYDAAGNRILRSPDCTNSPGSGKTDGTEITEEVIPESKTSEESNFDIAVLFPNPTSANCIIVLNKEVNNATLVVYDYQGKVMNYQRVNGTQFELNLSRYASGSYIVTVNTEHKAVHKTVIKN